MALKAIINHLTSTLFWMLLDTLTKPDNLCLLLVMNTLLLRRIEIIA